MENGEASRQGQEVGQLDKADTSTPECMPSAKMDSSPTVPPSSVTKQIPWPIGASFPFYVKRS